MSKELQLELEKLFNSNQVIPVLTKYFKEDASVAQFLQIHPELDAKLFRRTLLNLAIHKRIPIATFVALLFKKMDRDIEGILVYLLYLVQLGILTIDQNNKFWSPMLSIPKEIQDSLDRWQYPLPLIVPPRKLTKNNQSGYHSVKYKSVILNQKAPLEDVNLDHLNRINSVAYKLNPTVLNNVQNKWDGKAKHAKKGTTTNSSDATKENNFKRYMVIASEQIQMLNQITEKLYFSWRMDFRGRSYSEGYYLNPQGNDWNRYSIQLEKEEVVRTI